MLTFSRRVLCLLAAPTVAPHTFFAQGAIIAGSSDRSGAPPTTEAERVSAEFAARKSGRRDRTTQQSSEHFLAKLRDARQGPAQFGIFSRSTQNPQIQRRGAESESSGPVAHPPRSSSAVAHQGCTAGSSAAAHPPSSRSNRRSSASSSSQNGSIAGAGGKKSTTSDLPPAHREVKREEQERDVASPGKPGSDSRGRRGPVSLEPRASVGQDQGEADADFPGWVLEDGEEDWLVMDDGGDTWTRKYDREGTCTGTLYEPALVPPVTANP
ncbi:unnamed protein product [Amoebophrya sp. A120]|nr:unnamed protein product [Amoebophrya sp. A120]|eukprot:GSA120T00012857001.1